MKKSALIAALALVVLAPATGEAKAPSSKQCPKNSLCLWSKPDYEGKKLVIKSEGASNVGKQMNNKVSSAKSRYSNPKTDRVYLFDKRNAKGSYFCLGGGLVNKVDNLGPPYSFDNMTTSVLLPKSDEGPVCV